MVYFDYLCVDIKSSQIAAEDTVSSDVSSGDFAESQLTINIWSYFWVPFCSYTYLLRAVLCFVDGKLDTLLVPILFFLLKFALVSFLGPYEF